MSLLSLSNKVKKCTLTITPTLLSSSVTFGANAPSKASSAITIVKEGTKTWKSVEYFKKSAGAVLAYQSCQKGGVIVVKNYRRGSSGIDIILFTLIITWGAFSFLALQGMLEEG